MPLVGAWCSQKLIVAHAASTKLIATVQAFHNTTAQSLGFVKKCTA